MGVNQAPLPPFREVEAALRATTERLVAELHAPAAESPDWSPFTWTVARAVASMQGISGLLVNRLRWRGPDSWHKFLTSQSGHNAARGERAAGLLLQIDALAREAGIAFVALKGSALRGLGLYAPGERPMADVDLLVRPADIAPLARLIASLGYEEMYSSRRHAVLAPVARSPLTSYAEHRDLPLRIELHPGVAEELPVETVDITRQLWPEHPVPGGNAYPGRGMLLLHLLLHASGAVRSNALRAIQLQDIAALSRGAQSADWRWLFARGQECWWTYPVLSLTDRHFPGSISPAVLAESRDLCPRWLRQRMRHASLFEFSWSNPRVAALPGVEWSRSLRHALRVARRRVFQDRVALAGRAQAALSQPQLMHSRWYEVSHAERILRWMAGRARRVQTMTSVMAACAEGDAPDA